MNYIISIVLVLIILDVWIWITPVESTVSTKVNLKGGDVKPKWSTTTRKTRRTKKKIRRSPKPPPTTKKKKLTKITQKPKYDWALILQRYQEYYCMKSTECTNEHLYFEREPKRECARHFLDHNDMVWFDHKCSVWVANCWGMGMYFRKTKEMCENNGVAKFIDEDFLDPPRTIRFAIY